MSLYDVSDYRLDPPEPHQDYCSCDDCHSLHRDDGIQNYAGECDSCADELAADQEVGVRCEHGELVPYISDPRDKFTSMRTDVECPKCQIDYGPALAAVWLLILNREVSRIAYDCFRCGASDDKEFAHRGPDGENYCESCHSDMFVPARRIA